MSVDMTAPRLFRYLKHERGTVLAMDRASWDAVKPMFGSPVELRLEDTPLTALAHDACVLAATATRSSTDGVTVEVFRYDPNDSPTPVNKDRYAVWENLHLHTDLDRLIAAASTSDDEGVRQFISRNVFLFKQDPGPGHWHTTLPSTVIAIINGT